MRLEFPRGFPPLLRPLVFVAALFGVTALHAQSVRWENGDSSTGSMIQLVFEDCEPDGEPQLPAIPTATLTLAGTSTSMNMVNFNVTRSVILTYMVQTRRGNTPLQIPAFSVRTNKGLLPVAAFNAAAPTVSADSVASGKLIPEKSTVWVGEVFALTYELTAARRNNPQINPGFDWNPAPLIAEDWSKYEVTEPVVNGQRQAKLTYHTRAYGKTPTTVKLEAVSQIVQVQTGSASFGLFSQPRMEPVSVTSDQPTIEIRPLPAAPAGFSGAVGTFKLTSKVVPAEAGVGEPVTWTLELSGIGNWPEIEGLPARDVSRDFQVVQPKAKRTPVEGKLFEVTLAEDVVLVPTKAGTYTLGPVAFTFFNPKTGSYETLRTERTTVKVAAPATQPAATTAVQPPSATEPQKAELPPAPRKDLTAPAAPAGIPHDPLPGEGTALRPLSTGTLLTWLLVPLLGLIGLWFGLAWRHARQTDPLRPQREAHARLAALLADVRGKSGGRPSPAQLLRWQHDAATLWQVRHAAPSARAFAGLAGGSTGAAEWTSLWQEADRALYGKADTLPPDWAARAEAALAAKRVPGFKPWRLFLPQNLLAFAAAVAVVLALAPLGAFALEATGKSSKPATEVAYRAGDFATAETAWRQSVAQRPTDWIARHNLSLALAQLDRPGEAAAHAAAAFVQHPKDPAVRRNFALAADKAGFAPAPLLPFLKEGPSASIAALAGAGAWQRILIATAFLVAGAIGWLLWNAYGRRAKAIAAAALGLGVVAVVAGCVAIFGVVAYGETADARAMVTFRAGTLRSIPTEADTTQKTTTLAPGSIGVVNREFLGWNRVVFANGQSGWVRREELVGLWK